MLNAWSFWNNHMGGLQGRVKQQAKSKGWIEQAPASTRPWEGSGVIGVSNCVSLPAFLSSERDCTLGQEWAKSNFFFFSAPLTAISKHLLPSPHARLKLVSTRRLQAGVPKAGPAGQRSLTPPSSYTDKQGEQEARTGQTSRDSL